MSGLPDYLKSSVGKKQILAVAAQLLCAFVLVHLAGNLTLFVGQETFNNYATLLEKNPMLIPAELGLIGMFLVHISVAVILTVQNWMARPVRYEVNHSGGETDWLSTTMPYTGLLILSFIVFHLLNFKFHGGGHVHESGHGMDGLYGAVAMRFQHLPSVVFYVVAMLALGMHLWHGFQSAFQTLGIHHPRYTPLVKKIGAVYAFVIAVGFASFPLWFYFNKGAGN